LQTVTGLASVPDATSPIDIDKLNAAWEHFCPGRLLANMRASAEAVLSERGISCDVRPSDLPRESPPECRAAAHALACIDEVQWASSAGDPDILLSEFLRLLANWSQMRVAPLQAELRRVVESVRAERSGLAKGCYAAYGGSKADYDAALAEFSSIRDQIVAEKPTIKKAKLYEMIAKASRHGHAITATAVRRGLKKLDNGRVSKISSGHSGTA
jgi:hypothetical protein